MWSFASPIIGTSRQANAVLAEDHNEILIAAWHNFKGKSADTTVPEDDRVETGSDEEEEWQGNGL